MRRGWMMGLSSYLQTWKRWGCLSKRSGVRSLLNTSVATDFFRSNLLLFNPIFLCLRIVEKSWSQSRTRVEQYTTLWWDWSYRRNEELTGWRSRLEEVESRILVRIKRISSYNQKRISSRLKKHMRELQTWHSKYAKSKHTESVWWFRDLQVYQKIFPRSTQTSRTQHKWSLIFRTVEFFHDLYYILDPQSTFQSQSCFHK